MEPDSEVAMSDIELPHIVHNRLYSNASSLSSNGSDSPSSDSRLCRAPITACVRADYTFSRLPSL